jgi:hypothetical protein
VTLQAIDAFENSAYNINPVSTKKAATAAAFFVNARSSLSDLEAD